ncbi:MAG: histidine triad nucleotide-binding protein [Lachnospiraceae bacterium]
MADCLFCKIIAGEIPSKKIYEDDLCYAFYDIAPQADTHFLVVSKQHLDSAAQITAENAEAVAHIFTVIPKLCRELGLDSYRIINNCGAGAGQTVLHLHFHVLSGANLSERLV